MMNFFNAILDFLQNAFLFLGNIINSTLNAVLLIGNLPTFITVLIGFVPPALGASLTVVLAVGIVKLVLGWGNAQ